ncbi:MAG: hypothetical protein AAGF89_00490 [Bacteroidota bacterium]
MPTDPRILTHPGLTPLWESMERERRQQQFVAVPVMVLGLFIVVAGLLAQSMWTPLVGGAMASGALWWLYRLLSEQPIAYWRRQLREAPETIVWVYGLVTERMPFGLKTVAQATLYLVETDGQVNSFALKPAELKLVTKTLNRVLPHAEFGYTEEREMKYTGEITNFRGRPERDPFNLMK